MIQIRQILVPTDFSEHSRNALEYGCDLARRYDARLHVVHAVQDLVMMVPEPGMAFPLSDDYMEDLKASAENELAQLCREEIMNGIETAHKVLVGPPFLEIVRYARSEEIDLIVIGTHGRTGLTHVLLGSVAEKVVRKAPCNVFTIRPEDHKFEMP